MSKFTALISKFAREDEGAALAEYAILLGIIGAAVIATIGLFAGAIDTKFKAMCNVISPGACP